MIPWRWLFLSDDIHYTLDRKPSILVSSVLLNHGMLVSKTPMSSSLSHVDTLATLFLFPYLML